MTTINELEGSRWEGSCELWLDPNGNVASTSRCRISVGRAGIQYEWSHEGETHRGAVTLREEGADFQDSFHSSETMSCCPMVRPGALFCVLGSYRIGDGPAWGWQLTLSLRPTDELVFQMTNIAPWGEPGRAMRVVAQRAE